MELTETMDDKRKQQIKALKFEMGMEEDPGIDKLNEKIEDFINLEFKGKTLKDDDPWVTGAKSRVQHNIDKMNNTFKQAKCKDFTYTGVARPKEELKDMCDIYNRNEMYSGSDSSEESETE